MTAAALLLLLPSAPCPPPRPDPAVVADLWRMPSAECCADRLDWLRARRDWLAGQRLLYADAYYAPWFEAAEADCRGRLECWAALAAAWEAFAARRPCYGPDPDECRTARGWLDLLRERVGEDAWRSGQMPSVMGVEYWRRAD